LLELKWEQKFHEYFYSSVTELRLSHFIAIKQKHTESIIDYIMRFRDTRNKCFNLNISENDLTDLALFVIVATSKRKTRGSYFFSMLPKSYKGLWIVKAEPKRVETSLGVLISLGMIVTSTWSNMLASHQITRD
jgi:hypothetical protein